jgi:hypothetical protein
MESFRASLRVHVVAIAVLLCLTLAFVAMTSKGEPITRFFFGFFSAAAVGVLLSVYRKETAIAESHVVASGTVTEVKTGRRGGRNIEYHFVAFNGGQYEGESDWGARSIGVGSSLLVLYKSLDPAVNLPVTRFLFYSFDAYGS